MVNEINKLTIKKLIGGSGGAAKTAQLDVKRNIINQNFGGNVKSIFNPENISEGTQTTPQVKVRPGITRSLIESRPIDRPELRGFVPEVNIPASQKNDATTPSKVDTLAQQVTKENIQPASSQSGKQNKTNPDVKAKPIKNPRAQNPSPIASKSPELPASIVNKKNSNIKNPEARQRTTNEDALVDLNQRKTDLNKQLDKVKSRFNQTQDPTKRAGLRGEIQNIRKQLVNLRKRENLIQKELSPLEQQPKSNKKPISPPPPASIGNPNRPAKRLDNELVQEFKNPQPRSIDDPAKLAKQFEIKQEQQAKSNPVPKSIGNPNRPAKRLDNELVQEFKNPQPRSIDDPAKLAKQFKIKQEQQAKPNPVPESIGNPNLPARQPVKETPIKRPRANNSPSQREKKLGQLNEAKSQMQEKLNAMRKQLSSANPSVRKKISQQFKALRGQLNSISNQQAALRKELNEGISRPPDNPLNIRKFG